MVPNIYISTGAFNTRSLSAILEICFKWGITNLEMSSGIAYDEKISEYIERGHNNGLHFLIHNYFPPPKLPFVLNLASENNELLTTSIMHCKSAIDLCDKYSVPFFSVHCGFALHANASQLGDKLTEAQRFDYEKAEGIFIKSINDLCDYASRKNISVLIENNVLAPMNLVNGKNELLIGVTHEDLKRILTKVCHRNFGFLIDTGHLKVSANTLNFSSEEFIYQLKDNILAFHLNDNDGLSDNNLPFDSKSWFMPLIRKHNDKIFVLEAYKLRIEQIKDCIRLIEEAL